MDFIAQVIIFGFLITFAVLLLMLLLPQKTCPDCGKTLPKFRRPKNMRQRLWGGWTCQFCGCEVDRKGKKASECTPKMTRKRPVVIVIIVIILTVSAFISAADAVNTLRLIGTFQDSFLNNMWVLGLISLPVIYCIISYCFWKGIREIMPLALLVATVAVAAHAWDFAFENIWSRVELSDFSDLISGIGIMYSITRVDVRDFFGSRRLEDYLWPL